MATRANYIPYPLENVNYNQAAAQVWTTITAGTVFADDTVDFGDSGAADVPLTTVVDDAIYFGADTPFVGIYVALSTARAGGSVAWEYWNGSIWTTFTKTFITGQELMTATTISAYWTAMSDWATTSVNAVSKFYMRVRNVTTLSTAGAISLGQIAQWQEFANGKTLKFAETASRTFTAVTLEMYMDMSITAAQVDLFRVEGRLGGSGAWTALVTNDNVAHTTSGEHQAHRFMIDLTSLFTAGFGAGATQTIELRAARLYRGVRATSTENYAHINGFIHANYTFDDTSAPTRMNWAIIPTDSLTSALPNTQTTIGGTGGWPIMTGGSGFIKGASPTIEDFAIMYRANSSETGSSSFAFYGQVDSETETIRANLASTAAGISFQLIWRRMDLSFTAAHDVKARVTPATGNDFSDISVKLIAVWSYDFSTSTVDNFSGVYCKELTLGAAGGTTAADAAVSSFSFQVPVASPTLLQSGIEIAAHMGDDPGNYLVKIGSQTARTYPAAHSGGQQIGPAWVQQRLDSGGAAGSGHTLVRGENTITVKTYVDTTILNVVGEYSFLYLNYSYTLTAGKRISRAMKGLSHASYASVPDIVGSFSFPIPETNYKVDHVGIYHGDTANTVRTTNVLQFQRGSELGFDRIVAVADLDAFHSERIYISDASAIFKRHPNDFEIDRMDIETSRNYRLTGVAKPWAMVSVIWHDYTWTISSAISYNYNPPDADGAGMSVVALKVIPLGGGNYAYEPAASAVTTAGGAWTIEVFDDTFQYEPVGHVYGSPDKVAIGVARYPV